MGIFTGIVIVAAIVATLLTFEPNLDRLPEGDLVLWYNTDDPHKHRKYIILWRKNDS